jgi:hypothetical protein
MLPKVLIAIGWLTVGVKAYQTVAVDPEQDGSPGWVVASTVFAEVDHVKMRRLARSARHRAELCCLEFFLGVFTSDTRPDSALARARATPCAISQSKKKMPGSDISAWRTEI